MVATGRIKIVEVSTSVDPSARGLRSTYESFAPILDPSQELPGTGDSFPRLIILDDISTLQWIGFEACDIHWFLRALKALCAKVCRSLSLRTPTARYLTCNVMIL